MDISYLMEILCNFKTLSKTSIIWNIFFGFFFYHFYISISYSFLLRYFCSRNEVNFYSYFVVLLNDSKGSSNIFFRKRCNLHISFLELWWIVFFKNYTWKKF
jgi:hypothetical protein